MSKVPTPKPDLATADETVVALLVSRGVVQLSEIPQRNRRNIERKVADLEAEAAKVAEASEPEEAPQMEISAMNVVQLKATLDEKEIADTSKDKKADLIALLEGA